MMTAFACGSKCARPVRSGIGARAGLQLFGVLHELERDTAEAEPAQLQHLAAGNGQRVRSAEWEVTGHTETHSY